MIELAPRKRRCWFRRSTDFRPNPVCHAAVLMSQLRKSSRLVSHIRKVNKINHLRECVSLEIASRVRSITCGGQAALDDVRNSFV